jgi:hypothetical protein
MERRIGFAKDSTGWKIPTTKQSNPKGCITKKWADFFQGMGDLTHSISTKATKNT